MKENQSHVITGLDQNKMFSHLKDFFNSSYQWIPELIQNSRRAGATTIRFNVENNKVIIADNSPNGVTNFPALVQVAESDWDDETTKKDAPYGMGFISSIFASQKVTVASNGQKIEIVSAEFKPEKKIPIEPSLITEGTMIKMEIDEQDIGLILTNIRNFAQASSIKVFLDNEEIEREAALTDEYIDIGVGKYKSTEPHGNLRVYYQENLVMERSVSFKDVFRGIIHLDENQFRIRMPDRSALINEEDAYKKILAALEKSHIKSMRKYFDTHSGYDFDKKYGSSIYDYTPDLLEQLEFIPAWCLSEVDMCSSPCLSMHFEYHYLKDTNDIVHKSDIGNNVLLINESVFHNEGSPEYTAASLFVDKLNEKYKDVLVVNTCYELFYKELITIKDNHIEITPNKIIKTIDDFHLYAGYPYLRDGSVSDDFKLVGCESVNITIDNFTATITEDAFMDIEPKEQNKMFIPVKSLETGLHDTLSCYYVFDDDTEDRREEWKEQDTDAFIIMCKTLFNKNNSKKAKAQELLGIIKRDVTFTSAIKEHLAGDYTLKMTNKGLELNPI